MKDFEQLLFDHQHLKYAAFQAKLTPNIDPKSFIGVRVPEVRNIAKSIKNHPGVNTFLNELPHRYYDENMLHGCLLMQIKDYDECIKKVEKFLPYVDCWSVCDIMSPKCFAKHKVELLKQIRVWCKSSHTYTIRFGIEMLMSHFLDDDFKEEYLNIVTSINSEEYYVKMMIAWFFATALTKQWASTIKVIENKMLNCWEHNKTIQKAIESYRITPEQKDYLRTLKIK